jgi:hypothetical protein
MLLEKMNGTKPVLIDCTTIADLVTNENGTQGETKFVNEKVIRLNKMILLIIFTLCYKIDFYRYTAFYLI